MLTDRRALIEQELALKKEKAAALYLKIVTDDYAALQHQGHYDQLKTEISDLEFDLKIINNILSKS